MSRSRDPARVVKISNIPFESTEIELRQLFSTVGAIVSFEFEPHHRATRTARCEYPDAEIAKVAVREFDRHIIKGKTLAVGHLNKFSTKSNPQNVTGSQIDRNSTNRPVQGSKNSINEQYVQSLLASMTEKEQAEVLCEFKSLVTNHPDQVRQLLIDSPQFAHTILSLMTMFQLVDNNTVQNFMNLKFASSLQNPSPNNTSQNVPSNPQHTPNQGSQGGSVQNNQLTEKESQFYARWQSYDETQRNSLRTTFSSAHQGSDPQVLTFASLFRNVEEKLGRKL
jgi:RNA recognition motif-containing protein